MTASALSVNVSHSHPDSSRLFFTINRVDPTEKSAYRGNVVLAVVALWKTTFTKETRMYS